MGSPTGSVPHLAVPSNVGEMEQVARVAIAHCQWQCYLAAYDSSKSS